MLKAAVYKAVIILVLMCGSDTWALRNAVQNFLERTDMTMLIWMMRIKSIEKIGNEEIRTRAGVANISEKIKEEKLKWLCHVKRKTEL